MKSSTRPRLLNLSQLLDRIPDPFKWSVHNLVGHPLSEVCYLVGLRRAADWVHDATIPTHEPGQGRG